MKIAIDSEIEWQNISMVFAMEQLHIRAGEWRIDFEYIRQMDKCTDHKWTWRCLLLDTSVSSSPYFLSICLAMAYFAAWHNDGLVSRQNLLTMIKSYLGIAFRTLKRNRTFSMINVLGLVIGISFSSMLYIYVSNELSYDSFHKKADRIYRIVSVDRRDPENPRKYGVTVPPLGKELLNNYPEVVEMVRMHQFMGQVVFEMDGQNFQERRWATVDPNFFEVFDFEWVSGDRSTALKDPFSLVITESMARKYFGETDPVGQVIEKTNFGPVKVTGVISDFPDNSHLQFDFLFSNVRTDEDWTRYMNSWRSFGAYTYIVLDEKNSIEELRKKMPELLQKNLGQFAGAMSVEFQPIKDIYLSSSDIEGGAERGHGQMSYLYIFSSMGIFLLVIACINYINLTTSKALTRSKEIGVRKVVGAYKGQLVFQFLTESFVVTLISMFLAVGVMDLVFPYFNQITGKSFDITLTSLRAYSVPLLVISIVIGMVSGGYPAFYLARLKPIASLRGKDVGRRGAANVRKGLVVFQFALTIVMIFSTIVIGRQLSFIQNKNIGFNKDQLLVVDINSGNVRRNFQTMKNEFANIPGVEVVGVSSRVPGEWKNIADVYVKGIEGVDSIRTYFMGFDEGMQQTYGLTMAAGNYFSSNSMVDSTTVLLNETAVKALNLSDPVGAEITVMTPSGDLRATVRGVIRDFNYQSLHEKIAPIIIGTWNNPIQSIDYFSLKFSGDAAQLIKQATVVHEMFDHYTPIEYHFLDQQLAMFYVEEQRADMIFKMGGVLSIVVACLGLFGLATYNIERRTKELGIRKVLGASSSNLFLLLSSSFTKQVVISFLIASPAAWFVMKEWLKGFEYKISMNAGIFIVSGLIALSIALATVSYRSLQAAKSNPLDALRQE